MPFHGGNTGSSPVGDANKIKGLSGNRSKLNQNLNQTALLASLNNSAGYNARGGKLAKTMLEATAVWRTDESHEKFAKLSSENLAFH